MHGDGMSESNTTSFRAKEVPGFDLAELEVGDELVFDTSLSLYHVQPLERNTDNEPPLWWVTIEGSGVLYPDPDQLYLVGSDTRYFSRLPGAERDPTGFLKDVIVLGFPVVVGQLEDAVILAPTEAMWLNGKKILG
jgi:hypothetical protein